jgi:hypothetical protein
MNLNTDTLWFEISVVCGITAFGSIFFGHFEEHTPKFKRVLKLVCFNIGVVLMSVFLGREWSFGFLGLILLGVVYVHGFWLPSKGINGLTGEPKKKYYQLKGWTKYLENNQPTEHEDESKQSTTGIK